MIATSPFVAEWHHHWSSCETFSFAKERHDWRRTVHQVTLGPPQRAPAWCNYYWTHPLWVELFSCIKIGRTHGNGSSPSRSVGAAVALCWAELGETPIWTCSYKGQSSRGLGSGSEAKSRRSGRGGRGGGRTERAQAGSCVFPRSDWVSCVLQVFGGGCGLGRLGGDLRVVTGASEGEPVEAGL